MMYTYIFSKLGDKILRFRKEIYKKSTYRLLADTVRASHGPSGVGLRPPGVDLK